jgi:hypothetical protein
MIGSINAGPYGPQTSFLESIADVLRCMEAGISITDSA